MFNHQRKIIDIKMLKKEIEELEKLKDYINENGYKNYEKEEADSKTEKHITIFLEDFIEKLTKLLVKCRVRDASFPAEFQFSESKFYRLCNTDGNTIIYGNEGLKFFIGYAYTQLRNYIFLGETHMQSHTYDYSTSKSHKLSNNSTSESESGSQKPSSSKSESEHSSSIKMGRYY